MKKPIPMKPTPVAKMLAPKMSVQAPAQRQAAAKAAASSASAKKEALMRMKSGK